MHTNEILSTTLSSHGGKLGDTDGGGVGGDDGILFSDLRTEEKGVNGNDERR